MDKRSEATSSTQTNFISCAKTIFVLTTNCRIDPAISARQQLRALPFDDPLKGRISYLASFGRFSCGEERLIMMECLNKLTMAWQTGKGLSQLVKPRHYRSITYQPGLAEGCLERCRPLIRSQGVRAMMKEASAVIAKAVLDAIDEAPNGKSISMTYNRNMDMVTCALA